MIACCDVDYRDPRAVAAGLWFHQWTDGTSAIQLAVPIAQVEPYQPGRFYLRELPCLLALLKKGPRADVVVLDGYVWLGDGQPGLGAHLYQALEEKVAIIGVAKTRYAGVAPVQEVRRGDSANPLYVTAAGIDLSEAARHVAEMHGPYRIPTLLKKVDQLCRGRA